MKTKAFNQDALVSDLYALYEATVKGIIDPQVAKVATASAREIGRLLELKQSQEAAKTAKKRR